MSPATSATPIQGGARDIDPAGPARRLPAGRGRPGEGERDEADRDVEVEDPAPGRREERRRPVTVMPAAASAASGWTEPRIAAPTTGPAAIPRKVSAPTTPSARGRAAPPNRCDAAAVPTGTSTPPPTAWTSRAAMSWSSVCDAPASAEPIDEDDQRAHEQPADAPQVGQPAGDRHRQDVDQQVAVDDPARLAQLDPGGSRRSDRPRSARIDGSATAVTMSSSPARKTPTPMTASSTNAERRSISGIRSICREV